MVSSATTDSLRYVYLDERDLISLAEGQDRQLAAELLDMIRVGKVQVVLSLMHVVETWKYADLEAKRHVAKFADSLAPIWLLFRSALFKEEMLRAYLTQCGEEVSTCLDIRSLSENKIEVAKHKTLLPFRQSVIETLSPGSLTKDPSMIHESFSLLLDLLENSSDFRKIVTAVTEVHEYYPDWSKNTKIKIKGELPGKVEWLSYILSSALRGLIFDAQYVSQFIEHFDIKSCPSIYVYLKLKDAINKDKMPTPHPSEMVDIIHVCALPYCDAFSTDKRIWDYIRRCKIDKTIFRTDYTRGAKAFKNLSGILDWINVQDHNHEDN